MRLLIISHTPHYKYKERIVGWGPTVREIDQLATLFEEITHLAPLHPGPAPESSLPYTLNNVRFESVKPAGGDHILDKIRILLQIPGWLAAIKKAIKLADVIHIRCPAGISLVALLAARLWANRKPVWVKYAGNWSRTAGQPVSSKFQRWFIKNNLHRGVVTINGQSNGLPKYIFPFNNPSYSITEYNQIIEQSKNKQLEFPIKLLFVGRLTKEKGADQVVKIAKSLDEKGILFKLRLIGEGITKPALEKYVRQNALDGKVAFLGWQPMTAMTKFYQDAHFLIFPSQSEGWPKVLSEAMVHGVVPLASAISCIPEILDQTEAGKAIPLGDIDTYMESIFQYTQDPTAWKKASLNGINAGKAFTYDQYLSDVRSLFKQHFQIELNHE